MEKHIKSRSWVWGQYDYFFYGIVRGLMPHQCVELGTYAGHSAYWIAKALKDNRYGKLDCYDLWEDYSFNHVKNKEARNNLKDLPVKLYQEDALFADVYYPPSSVDLLNVDLSNTGEIYGDVLENWLDNLSDRAVVLMEGGIKERDKVDWMVRYKKTPICNFLKSRWLKSHFNYTVLEKYPGLTILTKKL